MSNMSQIDLFFQKIQSFFQNIGINTEFVIFGNTIGAYISAAVTFVLLLILFKIFQIIILGYLHRLAKKTKTDLDDTFIKIIRSLRPPFYSFLAVYFARQLLTINDFASKAIEVILIIWVTYQIIIAFQILLNYVVDKYVSSDKDDSTDTTTKSAFALLGKIATGILWAIGILMILSNLGINVSSLIAGLGIGGIAIAFALQNILGDLFSSFAIYFDKPFKVGDFIIVGEHLGTVEKIGIKTTRIKSLRGEELVISNTELTSTRIQNFKQMHERRITFTFGVVYQTTQEKLQKIQGMVKDIIDSVDMTRFVRAHFNSFGDSSLDFEVIYYVLSPDYNVYMDINQEILFKLKERFENEKIEFAYPTRTLYMAKETKS